MAEESKITSGNYISKGSIQETMLGPLWARATYSKLYPEILNDEKAIEVIEKIDYNFTEAKEFMTGKNEFRSLGLLLRAKKFENALLKYMEKYPYTTVVNLGAGLDTTFFRVDNGKIKWYDLDLSNAIGFRNQLIPEGLRNKCISKSVLDFSWVDDIEWSREKGIFFIAGGFVYYFKQEDLKCLFNSIMLKFPGVEIIFDAISKLALRKFNQLAKKAGKEEAVYFSVKNPENLFPLWSEKIEVVDWFTLWTRTEINPTWNKRTRKMIKLMRRLNTSKIIQLRFSK
ncbi:hypothetical protein ES703_87453 [subsurface metagenome]